MSYGHGHGGGFSFKAGSAFDVGASPVQFRSVWDSFLQSVFRLLSYNPGGESDPHCSIKTASMLTATTLKLRLDCFVTIVSTSGQIPARETTFCLCGTSTHLSLFITLASGSLVVCRSMLFPFVYDALRTTFKLTQGGIFCKLLFLDQAVQKTMAPHLARVLAEPWHTA